MISTRTVESTQSIGADLDKEKTGARQTMMDFVGLCRRYLQLVARRFLDDGCQHSAAALTYMTLFAVVPMMTVTFSMLSLVPVFQGVGAQVEGLFNSFLPSAGAEIQPYLADFANQARTLSVVGVIILVVTSYLMLHNIERVFNRIWATTGPRRGVAAFLLYWAVLSLGPLLVGTALLMNTYLLSVRLFTEELAQNAISILFGYLPWLLTLVAFTLLYTVVPNCKVMLRNALTGGVVATLALELAKSGFGYFVSNSSYTSIYGAFATLPIFLLWIYLCWMIILGGAEFVRATENFGDEIRGTMSLHTSAVFALWLFWRAHQAGTEVTDALCHRAGLSSDRWRDVRDRLMDNNVISVTANGNYVLLKSLDDVSLWDVQELFSPVLGVPDKEPLGLVGLEPEDNQWWDNYKGIMGEYSAASATMMSLNLHDLFALQSSTSAIDDSSDSNVTKIK